MYARGAGTLRSTTMIVVLSIWLVLLASGCTATPAGSSVADGPSPRSSDTDPGVVVALDDFAALNVLALGVTPDLSYDTFGYATTAAIMAEQGVSKKPYGATLNVEQVAAAKPDVIVGVSLPTTVEQKTRLDQIATTAILEYTADWQTALRGTAKTLGRAERAEEVITRIEADTDALKADLDQADQAGKAVSVIAGSTEDFFSPPVKTNLGALLAGLGPDRPSPQRAEVSASSPFVDISAERLLDHDGDALYLLEGSTYPISSLLKSPLYPRLEAVRQKRVHQVSGEMWFGSNPVSVQWVLDDIRATLLDGGQPLSKSAAPERLRSLVSSTGG